MASLLRDPHVAFKFYAVFFFFRWEAKWSTNCNWLWFVLEKPVVCKSLTQRWLACGVAVQTHLTCQPWQTAVWIDTIMLFWEGRIKVHLQTAASVQRTVKVFCWLSHCWEVCCLYMLLCMSLCLYVCLSLCKFTVRVWVFVCMQLVLSGLPVLTL